MNSNIEFLLNEIKIVNSSINEVGISISKIAKSLYEIKNLLKIIIGLNSLTQVFLI